MNLTVSMAKSSFFDRQRVIDAVDKATRKVLSKAGAFVRQRAKTLIRYRDRPSAAGSPPSAHRTVGRVHKKSGKVVTKKQLVSPLREFMFFSYDRRTKTVVIGPALLSGTQSSRALHALEYGGPTVILAGGRRKSITIRARPFMRPAMAAEMGTFPGLFSNSVK
jgi:hypothetical protein